MRWSRRRRFPSPVDAGRVVTIDVGYDRFRAHLLLEACRSQGYMVQLLTMDDHGLTPGLPALMPHRLLVRQNELEDVQALMARTD